MVSFEGYDPSDAKKKVGSFWSYLYPKKEDLDWIKNSVGEIVDSVNIDSFMPKMDDNSAGSLLARLQEEQGYVNANKKSWQDYFSTLDDNQKWQIDFVQNTDLQKASLDDVKIAQDKGRQVAIAHNAALKQQTLGAKAASVAMKGLALVGNVALSMLASLVVSEVLEWFGNLANAQENAIEKANEFIAKFEEQRESLKSNKETIDSISSDYEKLAKGVDSLGRNVSLNSDEYARYNEIVNQIADMFPQMVQGYTDEGNAIIKHKGNVAELTKAYEDQKKAAQDAIIVGSAKNCFKILCSVIHH